MGAIRCRVWTGARDTGRSLARQSLLVAVVCLVADAVMFVEEQFRLYEGPWPWLMLLAIVLVDVGLAAAPRLAGTVAVGQAAVTAAGAALLPPGSPPADVNDTGLLIAAYHAGAWLKGTSSALALTCLGAAVAGAELLSGADGTDWRVLTLKTLTNALLPWLVGRHTTGRRAYLAELEQRSERERRQAQQMLADALTQERSAIARDLHDVIAHHVSAIGMHAGAARLGLASPHTAKLTGALTAVETSSRAAMLDLRRMLDFLHGNSPDGARQPGLNNLDELVDAVRTAGLSVEVTTRGTPRTLPVSMDLAVYRVAQEMLTNALRHGDGQVTVELLYEKASITATATNLLPPGPRPKPESPRRGLEGIRSRAAMFNGSAVYGLTPDGTAWTLSATFPLDSP